MSSNVPTAHTFVVIARNTAGPGPGGSAAATPTAPRRHQRIDVRVSCPSFVAHNPNPYPVHVWWVTTRGAAGATAIPAGATLPVAPAGWPTAIVLGAGIVHAQDAAIGTC